jgi:secreted PhoX family phosphatase
MKKFYLLFLSMVIATASQAQFFFDVEIQPDWAPTEVIVPPSPLKFQVLFVGGVDKVQTTPTYGNAAGEAIAKQWHDFIGFTPDTESDDLGWVSVNHEMKEFNDSIGDGGGMTVFKVTRDPRTDEIIIKEQTLADGREGKFFNVDFVNTVGETGMNCGGLVNPEGRIWTAEEWWVSDNKGIVDRDTSDWTIGVGTANGQTVTPPVTPLFEGETIKKYQNKNWMVEIDPKEAIALRKQYNWGRLAFEGGAFTPDNTTVYLNEDDTPGLFLKFVATTPGDFTDGQLYVYKYDLNDAVNGNWIEVDDDNLAEMLDLREVAYSKGASLFTRLEWGTFINGKYYMAETGNDNVRANLFNAVAKGGVVNDHIIEAVRSRHGLEGKPDSEVLEFVKDGNFNDYYGRILVYDPETDMVEIFLDGGPFVSPSPSEENYPNVHLSNPDGLSELKVGGKSFMIIQEDLNGSSQGRVPAGFSNRTCEMYLLDMSIENPTWDDLVRIAVVPTGAEVTGAIATPDGKTILANSQHPSTNNPYPFNNSLTFAITGWDFAVSAITDIQDEKEKALNEAGFYIYPNPVSRTLNFNRIVDVALYNAEGKRMKVERSVRTINVEDLAKGLYILSTSEGFNTKVVIQ